MRIRKTTKLSSLLSGYGGEIPETYVCHFNQSPWDVIPLISSGNSDCASDLTNSSSFLPSPLLLFQCGEEDSYNENASLGDSSGAAERPHLIAVADNYERSPDFEELMDLSDNSDKKFKTEEFNSPAETSGDDEKVAFTMRGPPKRGRPRGTAKKAQATTKNPYEFYYYSGFGPRWGRKRGCEDNMRSNTSEEEEEEENGDKTVAFRDRYSNFDEMEYELVDNEDSEESEEVNEKKMVKMKRCRKPIKERSLKSLM